MTEANIKNISHPEELIHGAVWIRPLGGDRQPLLLLPDGAKVTPGEVWLDPARWIFWARVGKRYVVLPDLVPTYGAEKDALLIQLPGCRPIRLRATWPIQPNGLPPEALPFWEQAEAHYKAQSGAPSPSQEAMTKAWEHAQAVKAAERLEVYGHGGLEIMQSLASATPWRNDTHIRLSDLGIPLPYARRKTRASLLVGQHFAYVCLHALTRGAASYQVELETALRPYAGKDEGILKKNHEDNRRSLWAKAASLFLRLFFEQGPWESADAFKAAMQARREEREKKARMARALAMRADSGVWGIGFVGDQVQTHLIGGRAAAIHDARELAARHPGHRAFVTDRDGLVVYTTP